MVPRAHRRLSDDHRAVDELLKQLLAALNNKDVDESHAKLDLLWARLAVHIRAEHLHLFPAIISRSKEMVVGEVFSDYNQAQSVVDKLRIDHDFFMRELARSIAVLRELHNGVPGNEAKLSAIGDTVQEIERRLIVHNQIEEKQIYLWASTILTKAEQIELATRINAELENLPQRFSPEVWANYR
jgi:hemerythrin superfamily protein